MLKAFEWSLCGDHTDEVVFDSVRDTKVESFRLFKVPKTIVLGFCKSQYVIYGNIQVYSPKSSSPTWGKHLRGPSNDRDLL